MLNVEHNERMFISEKSQEVIPTLGQRVRGVLCPAVVVGIEQSEDSERGLGYMVYLKYVDTTFTPFGSLD